MELAGVSRPLASEKEPPAEQDRSGRTDLEHGETRADDCRLTDARVIHAAHAGHVILTRGAVSQRHRETKCHDHTDHGESVPLAR